MLCVFVSMSAAIYVSVCICVCFCLFVCDSCILLSRCMSCICMHSLCMFMYTQSLFIRVYLHFCTYFLLFHQLSNSHVNKQGKQCVLLSLCSNAINQANTTSTTGGHHQEKSIMQFTKNIICTASFQQKSVFQSVVFRFSTVQCNMNYRNLNQLNRAMTLTPPTTCDTSQCTLIFHSRTCMSSHENNLSKRVFKANALPLKCPPLPSMAPSFTSFFRVNPLIHTYIHTNTHTHIHNN